MSACLVRINEDAPGHFSLIQVGVADGKHFLFFTLLALCSGPHRRVVDTSGTYALMEAFNALEDHGKGIITKLCQKLAIESAKVSEHKKAWRPGASP